MSKFHALRVSGINRITDKAVSINFEVPTNLKEEFDFLAGQYVTLKTILDGNEIRRDYSLCSAPKSDNLIVAVKEVESGLFSKYANRDLKVGDTLEVSAPNGRFTFEPDIMAKRDFAAFVAGSGITPVLSIIKSILTEETLSTISIVYGNRSVSDTMFYDELVTLKNKYPDRFNLLFVFSQAQEENAMFGRIDNSISNYFLNNAIADKNIDTYYLCGPEEMIYQTSDLLKAKGIEPDRIKFELFTVKLEDKPEPTSDTTSVGQTKVTVMLDDEESSFTMSDKNTVLEAALAEDIDAPYSCQGGICSSCLARITKGKVKMRQNNILTDAEVEEGLVLTCQSQPLTPEIYVDWDDV